MIRVYLFILFLIFLISCNTGKSILIVKDTQIVDVPIETTISTFPWDNDFEGQRDSILIKNQYAQEIFEIISNLNNDNNYRHDIWVPRYAFLLEYNGIKDTLYYDDEFKEGYMVRNELRLIDTTQIMKKYLLKYHRVFLEKEY